MTEQKLLNITETEPVPLVKDFGIFCHYLGVNNPSLTRKGQNLMKKTLYEIDQLLSHPTPENSQSSNFYPHLTLYYHLALQGNLFIKTPLLTLQQTGRLADYEQLTPPEKYFFLLETFWTDMNMEKSLDGFQMSLPIPEIQRIMKSLSRKSPGESFSSRDPCVFQGLLFCSRSFLQYLSFFGLLQVVNDGLINTQRLDIPPFVVTDMGSCLFPILYHERNLEEWNIPYIQKEIEELVIFPGLTEDLSEEEYEPFFKPFQKFFKGELQRTLTRGNEHGEGTYVFKVSLRKNVWRTIYVSGEHTFEDLHEAIQDAFEFDKDHLYAFFIDGVPWSHRSIYAPQCDDGPSAEKVHIGQLRLQPYQRILYLFDFGDNWRFTLELLEIKSDSGLSSPFVGEKKGKAPEQYPW